MKRVLKLVTIFVIYILSIIGLSLVTDADASVQKTKDDYAQAGFSSTFIGNIFTQETDKDAKTGLTCYEALRQSFLYDLELTFKPWLDYIGQHTYDVNLNGVSSNGVGDSVLSAKAYLSVVNKDVINEKGSDGNAYSVTPVVTLPHWCDFFQKYSGSFFSTKAKAVVAADKKPYLNFFIGDTYSFSIAWKEDFTQVLRRALLDAFADYTYAIYEYNGTNKLEKLGTLDAKSCTLTYIVHPLLGVVPCQYYNKSISNLKDYLEKFYDTKKDNASTRRFGTLVQKYLNAKYVKKAIVYERYWLEDYKDKAYYTNNLGCYMQGIVWSTKSGNKGAKYSTGIPASLIIHPDYITFMLRIQSKNNTTTGYYITEESSLASPISVFSNIMDTNSSQSVTKIINTMIPIAYIQSWKSTGSDNVYGIYTMHFGTGNTERSTLSAFSMRGGIRAKTDELGLKEGENNVKFSTHPISLVLDYIWGLSSGKSAALSKNNLADSEKKKTVDISESDYTVSYYYNLADGAIYKPVPVAETLYHSNTDGHSKLDTSRAVQYIMASLGSSNTLASYEKTDIKLTGTLYTMKVTGINPVGNYFINKNGSKAIKSEFFGTQLTNILIPSTYNECVLIKNEETRGGTAGQTTKIVSFIYVETGRKVTFDLSNSTAMDLASASGVVKYSSDEKISGYYFNTGGRVGTSDKQPIEYKIIMSDDGPSIVLSDAYIEQSGLLNWLSSTDATSFLSARISRTGYTADSLSRYISSKGAIINTNTDVGIQDRLDEIKDELSADKSVSVIDFVSTALAFMGILAMVYACALVVAYYIDVFSPSSGFSLLGIITFGGLKAVQTRKDLDDLNISDPKERKRYVTRTSIIARWVLVMSVGLLLFSSNKVYVFVTQVYSWLASLFGIS